MWIKTAPLVLVLWIYTSVTNVLGLSRSVHGPETLFVFIIARDGDV